MNINTYKELKTATMVLMIFTVITGLIYPSLVTGIAKWFFPEKANGSFILHNGENLGSSLIGQYFDNPKYFWGRPSSTGGFPYNVIASKGSGLSPVNIDLIAIIKHRIEMLQKAHGPNDKIPIELVEASGSGIDPHISKIAAYYQGHRVAKMRGFTDEVVKKLIDNHTEDRQFFGLLGESRVNVLKLNLALDAVTNNKK